MHVGFGSGTRNADSRIGRSTIIKMKNERALSERLGDHCLSCRPTTVHAGVPVLNVGRIVAWTDGTGLDPRSIDQSAGAAIRVAVSDAIVCRDAVPAAVPRSLECGV